MGEQQKHKNAKQERESTWEHRKNFIQDARNAKLEGKIDDIRNAEVHRNECPSLLNLTESGYVSRGYTKTMSIN